MRPGPYAPAGLVRFPCHSPLTSTVTSVDWIQSGRVQPREPHANSPAATQTMSRRCMAGSYASQERRGIFLPLLVRGATIMVGEDMSHEPSDEDHVRKPSDRRAAAFGLLAVLCLISMCVPTLASDQDVRCSDYKSLDQAQRAYLAYGYLEGVQGALDKEGTDILVPPSDPRHPIWWGFPTSRSSAWARRSMPIARFLATSARLCCGPSCPRASTTRDGPGSAPPPSRRNPRRGRTSSAARRRR